jgi:ribosomal protein S16
MIKLRLKRFGKKREASFRLVATNSTSRRDGRPLEELGFYNPRTKETRLDTEAIRVRLSQGAQPTDTVLSLLEKGGRSVLLKPSASKSKLTPATLPPSRPRRMPRPPRLPLRQKLKLRRPPLLPQKHLPKTPQRKPELCSHG